MENQVNKKSIKLFKIVFMFGMVVILLLIIFLSRGSNSVLPNNNTQDELLQKLVDFPVFNIYEGEPAMPDFNSNLQAKAFMTKINEGAKPGPNFAGEYTVITWGCGTACQISTILHTPTGKIVEYGLLSARELDFSLDSSLLVVNPRKNLHPQELEDLSKFNDEHFPLGSTPATADYYVMTDGELSFLGKYHVISGESPTCIQVVVEARNPITEEIKQFGSPCSVPFGWDALESSSLES